MIHIRREKDGDGMCVRRKEREGVREGGIDKKRVKKASRFSS